MKLRRTVMGLAVSAVASYVGTRAMEPVSMGLHQWESDAARAREDSARPGDPYRIAAEKLSRQAGYELSEKQLGRLALVFHYGLALQWAPLYPLLRRRTQLAPLPAGLLTGAAMSVLADELMTPAFGFSAPNLDYPLVTHVRGFVAHLVFGTAVAATVGTGRALLCQRPTPQLSASRIGR